MKLKARAENKKLVFINKRELEDLLDAREGKYLTVEIKLLRKKITLKQNSAMHLYFTQLAEALNDAGYDMKKVLKEGVDIPWSMEKVKDDLWRPVQQAYLGKKSTTELESRDIDKIYDIINRGIAEKTGVHVPFPSLETLMEQE